MKRNTQIEESQLEKIGNVQLFFLLKNVIAITRFSVKEFVRDKYIMEDNNYIVNCDSAGKIMGIELNYPLDHNYILSTLRKNPEYDFNSAKPNGEIKRPEAHLYSFDYDEHRTEYVRRTYRHEITSYSEELVIPTVKSMEGEGSFEYYEGREVDVDYYDGETTDSDIDSSSVTKIK